MRRAGESDRDRGLRHHPAVPRWGRKHHLGNEMGPRAGAGTLRLQADDEPVFD
jgi:hypothetical protein